MGALGPLEEMNLGEMLEFGRGGRTCKGMEDVYPRKRIDWVELFSVRWPEVV
jgi:hypothetical protein